MKGSRVVHAIVAAVLVGGLTISLGGCGGGGSGDNIRNPSYAPVVPLTSQEVDIVVQRAAMAVDSPRMLVAVVDRVGRVLAVWVRNPAVFTAQELEDNVNIVVSTARTGAFMSSSQGPITSRTLEFISTFHFPAFFGNLTRNPIPTSPLTLNPVAPRLADQRVTTSVLGTPQGPLWQIYSSNRGAPYAGVDLVNIGQPMHTAFSTPSNGFTDMRIPPAGRIDATGGPVFNAAGNGLTYLAGGISLFKAGNTAAPGGPFDIAARVVGAVGTYIVDGQGNPEPLKMEFASLVGAGLVDPDGTEQGGANLGKSAQQIMNEGGNPLADLELFPPRSAVPAEGAIFLVGVLLPEYESFTRPANTGLGLFNPVGYIVNPTAGGEQPFGWIIGPRDDPDLTNPNRLTSAEVAQIVNQGILTAQGTRAAIRLPIGDATKMIFGVTNLRGDVLGAFRMEDAPVFSYDVSLTKARCVTYFSSSPFATLPTDPPMLLEHMQLLNDAGIPTGTAEFPEGVALTTRTFAFATQPFFPPGIDSSGTTPGTLFQLALNNADPDSWMSLGSNNPADTARPGRQSGIIFFPGATPLYKNGQLVGGLGVSGDGVEQDDFVTNGSYRGFEPAAAIRVDNFGFNGISYPFFKFPQLPGPGGGF